MASGSLSGQGLVTVMGLLYPTALLAFGHLYWSGTSEEAIGILRDKVISGF